MEGVVAEGVVWGFTFIALYGWVAVNVNVAIAADFFHRDVLLWKKGGGIAALVVVFLAYALASLPPWWFSPSESAIGSDIVTVLFALAALYAAVALAVTYRRIADRRIKTYTMWVLLSILGVLLLIVSPSVLIPVPAVIWIYCMYRSVGSLAIRTRNLGQ